MPLPNNGVDVYPDFGCYTHFPLRTKRHKKTILVDVVHTPNLVDTDSGHRRLYSLYSLRSLGSEKRHHRQTGWYLECMPEADCWCRTGQLRRGYLRDVLRNAGDGSGYECQEDEGAFMQLGFCKKDSQDPFTSTRELIPGSKLPALQSNWFHRYIKFDKAPWNPHEFSSMPQICFPFSFLPKCRFTALQAGFREHVGCCCFLHPFAAKVASPSVAGRPEDERSLGLECQTQFPADP